MILLSATIPPAIFQYLCCLPTLHECHCSPLIQNNQPSLADSTNAITASRRTYPPTVHLIQHLNFNNFHNSGRCCCIILSANSNVIAAARPAIPGHRTIVAAHSRTHNASITNITRCTFDLPLPSSIPTDTCHDRYCFCFLLLPAPRPPLATRQYLCTIHASTKYATYYVHLERAHTATQTREQKGSLNSRNGHC